MRACFLLSLPRRYRIDMMDFNDLFIIPSIDWVIVNVIEQLDDSRMFNFH